MLNNQVADYGWKEDKQIPSMTYLETAVVNACCALGVRRVLDLGCGKGDIARALVRSSFDVVGCDADAEGVCIAAKSCPQAEFHKISIYEDPVALGKNDFDAVVSTEVIEHLYAPRALLRFANNAIEPGSWLIITTPYHGYLKNLTLSLTNHWDRHFSPAWNGGHIKFFSRHTLTCLLEEEGFQVIRFQGLGRISYLWKSMLLVAQKK